jgi:hypothetical protein
MLCANTNQGTMNLPLQVLSLGSKAIDDKYLGFDMYIGRFHNKVLHLKEDLRKIQGRTMLIYIWERNTSKGCGTGDIHICYGVL